MNNLFTPQDMNYSSNHFWKSITKKTEWSGNNFCELCLEWNY